jgi:hypothetical protein
MSSRARRGAPDPRIAGFYETLRARFHDDPALDHDDNPWLSMPLGVGIDHVVMYIGSGDRGAPAVALIQELAIEYGLTLWDPQDGSAYPPTRRPSREDVARWWRELLDGRCDLDDLYDRVQPWAEDRPREIDDPITSMGVQQLHGFSVGADDQPRGLLFELWLAQGELYDADPEGWLGTGTRRPGRAGRATRSGA